MITDIFSISNSTTKADILNIIDNNSIERIQTDAVVDESIWNLIAKELLTKRPDIEIRIYGCSKGFNFNILNIISDVEVLSIDCIYSSENIHSFENLKNLKKLKSISIGIYDLKDFDFLKDLPETIESISLYQTKSKKPSLKNLERFKELKKLYLEGQQKDIDVIKKLEKLEELTLRSISTNDISYLSGLTNLWYLDIKLGGIKSFDTLKNMKNIKYLELWRIRGIKNISFVKEMNGLQFLFLQDLNNIEEFPDLTTLTSLRRIHLDNLKGLKNINALFESLFLEEFSHCNAMNFIPEQYDKLFEIKTLKKVCILFGNVKKNNRISEMIKKHNILEFNFYEPFIYR